MVTHHSTNSAQHEVTYIQQCYHKVKPPPICESLNTFHCT